MRMAELKGRKIEAMHRLYGVHHGKTCAECKHLIHIVYRSFSGYKCTVYGLSCSEATDWRLEWQACGLIDRDKIVNDKPVIDMLRYEKEKKEAEPVIPGQITMTELLGGNEDD